MAQFKEANPKATPPTEEKVRCQVMSQLVLQKVLLAKSDIDSVTVKDDEVRGELDERMTYMIQQVGGRDRLEQYYKKTVEQFKAELRKQVKEQLIARKMQGKITDGVKVTPAQVRRYFNAIPKDSVPFFSTEVEVGQIVRLFKAGKQRKLDAKAKAEKLRKEILEGGDFALMAKLYSQDPGSAQQGGKLMGAQRGQMVPEYEAAAMALKPGETSPVTESQFGYHIIQILDKRGNEYDSRHILIQPAASDDDREYAFRFLDSLGSAIRHDSISFDQAAQKYSDDQVTKNAGGFFMDPSSNSPRVPTQSLDPKVFFVIDTMKIGSVSHPLSYVSEDGKHGYRILYYKNKILPHEANLRDDYQRIMAGALNEAKRKATLAWLKKAKQDVAIYVDPEFEGCNVLKNLEN
jgi:peptidyl-prolyl cis-trans isomerase SurA